MTHTQRPSNHILIIDDDDRIRQLLSDYLKTKGFATSLAGSANEGGRLMAVFDYDLVILDYMMPQTTGLEFLVSLRAISNIPVLMLTAKSALEDRIDGLSAGADDYLAKPFAPEELYLRMNAILGRIAPTPSEQVLSFGLMQLNLASMQLSNANGPINLTESEEALLLSLVNAQGEVKTRDVLSVEFSAAPRSIDVLITRLRRKIEVNPSAPQFIKTVRGVGYRFAAHA